MYILKKKLARDSCRANKLLRVQGMGIPFVADIFQFTFEKSRIFRSRHLKLTGYFNSSFAISWKQATLLVHFHFSFFKASQSRICIDIAAIQLRSIPPVCDVILKCRGGSWILGKKSKIYL